MGSYVYFITDDHGHVKIGKANDVAVRMFELQTGNPYKLRILLSIPLPSEKEAFRLEQLLHQKFARERMEGEWFNAESVLKFLSQDTCEIAEYSFLGRGLSVYK